MCKQLAGIPQHWHPPPHPTPPAPPPPPSFYENRDSLFPSVSGWLGGRKPPGRVPRHHPCGTPQPRVARPREDKEVGGRDGEDSPPQSRLLSTPRRRGTPAGWNVTFVLDCGRGDLEGSRSSGDSGSSRLTVAPSWCETLRTFFMLHQQEAASRVPLSA